MTDRLALRLIWSKCCLITFVSHGWVTYLLCRFVTAFHCRSELRFFSLTSTDDTINLRHNGDKMLSEVVSLFFMPRNFKTFKVFNGSTKIVKILIFNQNESRLFFCSSWVFPFKESVKICKN